MDWEMLSVWIENTICYSGSSQGIWTCIPCEAGITIVFYWNVPIKLALETTHKLWHLAVFAYWQTTNFYDLLFLQTKINIGTDMGNKICQTNCF